jgi:D-cysteine desulfhydrase family pyridoxal phosphate-dependent enzyme
MDSKIQVPQPRYRVALTPTPLEALPTFSAKLGVQLSVKRDDLSGIAFGGNKLRQLEYFFGEAKSVGATAVIVTGAIQSNFTRATAAVAARAGMRCHVQLEDRVPLMQSPVYHASGNAFLNKIFGATVSCYPHPDDEAGAEAAVQAVADSLKRQGERPYVISLTSTSTSIGALGYLHAAVELMEQRPTATHFVVPAGSGQTQAGLLFGLRMLGSQAQVLGFCVRRSAELQRKRVAWHCAGIAKLLGVSSPVAESDIVTSDCAMGTGYGLPDQEIQKVILDVARAEGLLLDHVYTGKGFLGLLNYRRSGHIAAGADVVFVHTGGLPAVFAYEPEISQHMRAHDPAESLKAA